MTLEARKIRLIMELRSLGLTDFEVLGAIERVPRERFVPPTFEDKAYEYSALPIGGGQTFSQPAVVAHMTTELRLEPRHKVLEVGTGSGYQAGVLSLLCRRLYTVERDPSLLRVAEARFRDLRLNNIVTRLGDGGKGWPEQAPFDRILVTAAADTVPAPLLDQLAPRGILLMPVGPAPDGQRIVRCIRRDSSVEEEDLWPVRFVPLLPGVAKNVGFH